MKPGAGWDRMASATRVPGAEAVKVMAGPAKTQKACALRPVGSDPAWHDFRDAMEALWRCAEGGEGPSLVGKRGELPPLRVHPSAAPALARGGAGDPHGGITIVFVPKERDGLLFAADADPAVLVRSLNFALAKLPAPCRLELVRE